MASIIPGYNYDIFISYRQNDNKYDGWVTEFVDNLNKELEANIKDRISVYFDINPHDGLLETHSVDQSLEDKLKCLIFIPIISRTYCDPKSFAWQHEFVVFNKLAKEDQFGRDIRLAGGNVASRILPVKIHDLDPEDISLLEKELGGVLRSIEFIYKSSGVNRSLRANEDHPQDNINKTYYRDQINKVANAVKEIMTALKKHDQQDEEVSVESIIEKPVSRGILNTKSIAGSIIVLIFVLLGVLFIPKPFKLDKSVAVLPFKDISPNQDQEYIAAGFVEAILDQLYHIGDLKIISNTSSSRYKDSNLPLKKIAKELGASSILEGSVQKIGDSIRIVTQLIDAKTDIHLWSETYNRDFAGIFSIYSEVAQNVTKELKAVLTSKESDLIQTVVLTTNQSAYDLYLKGNNSSNRSLAIEMYTEAIKEDSLFAAAYAKRANAHLALWWFKNEGWQDHDSLGLKDIEKALSLQPELVETKIAQGYYYYWVKHDYDKALEIIYELKSESPNIAALYNLSANILRRQGKWKESIIDRKCAVQLNPANPETSWQLGLTHLQLHQYNNAIKWFRKGLSINPDFSRSNDRIFDAYLYKTADLEIAVKESGLRIEDRQYKEYYYNRDYEYLIELINKDSTIVTNQYTYEPKTFRLALIYYLSGNKSNCKTYSDSAIIDLKEEIKEIPDDDRFYSTLGKSYAFIGDKTLAVEFGKKAVELKPIKLDVLQGTYREQDLMEIYIFTGDYDLAMDKMEYLLSIPGFLYVGEIKNDPIYDNLRNLPRFKKIIDSAPKKIKAK